MPGWRHCVLRLCGLPTPTRYSLRRLPGRWPPALLVYGLALGAGVSRTTLVLAGLAVSGMLTAGMNTIKLLYPDAIAGASDFLVGGLSGVTLSGLKGAVPYLITGTLLALLLAAT